MTPLLIMLAAFIPPAPNTSLGFPPTITPGTQVEKLATLPTESYTIGKPFTEGTTCAPNGDVYFIEQNSDKIMRWDVRKDQLEVFLHPSGRSNGMCFDYQGKLISCADLHNQLWSIDLATKRHEVLVKDYQGKLLDGPNDVWVRPDGGMYLTDPYYKRPWWPADRKPQMELKTVYFLSPDHTRLTRVLDRFDSPDGTNGTPNGIAGTPDGKTLYVSDITGGRTWAFDIQPDGSLTHKRLTCEFGSDGMTLDTQGNLYMSVGGGDQPGVTVVDTHTGKQVGFIPVPEKPANMCFGGTDRQTLYICARTGFYRIRTNAHGANPGK